jgi:hypothetical protein
MAQRLATDTGFRQRVQSCLFQESIGRSSDPDPASAWMADDQLRGTSMTTSSMVNMIASFPGLVDAATITAGDGTLLLDQTAISDQTILSQVQANWKTVADLFYLPPTTP